jgi:sugar lactone lactonase YvrE
MALSGSAQTTGYVLSRYAGALSASVDGPIATARFDRPAGLVFDQAGNLYVADSGSHTIRRISPNGIVTTIAGKPGVAGISDGVGSGARFTQPGPLTVDRRGNLYVASFYGTRVQRVTPNGVATTIANEPALFENSTLSSIAVDNADNLYIAFSWPGVVRKRTPAGTISTFAGDNGYNGVGTRYPYQLPLLSALAVDSEGILHISYGQNLVKLPLGAPSSPPTPGRAFSHALAIAVGSDGAVYGTVQMPFQVQRLNRSGELSILGGSYAFGYVDGNAAQAEFADMNGIAVDRLGNVLVSQDYLGAGAIRKIASEGQVTTLSGKATRALDGPFDQALFQSPAHMVADGAGNLFVADFCAVRQINAAGVVTTIAGNPAERGNVDGAGYSARFGSLTGITIDRAGTVYVSDNTANTIRKINPQHVVSTLAGGASGVVDGVGPAAGFASPGTLTVDGAGNIYLVDNFGRTIRKITPDRVVTTVAGSSEIGHRDGSALEATFGRIIGLAMDKAGTLFVADDGYIRKLTRGGMVSTFAGIKANTDVDGAGNQARFTFTNSLVIDSADNLYTASNSGIRKIAPDATVSTLLAYSPFDPVSTGIAVDANDGIFISGPRHTIWKISPPSARPVITAAPQSRAASFGANVTLTSAAFGSPTPRIQWCRNGDTIGGAVSPVLTLREFAPAATGLYSVIATSNDASTTSSSAIVGLVSTKKVIGSGTEVGADIRHRNGNVFDQVLLTGTAEAITADYTANQITRTSYVDLTDDIVQVEFSGPGTLSLVLENFTDPETPVNYNQPSVSYMKGLAGIIITGADERTNVSVFTVGRTTAVDQTLFKNDIAYDGIADIAFIAISTTNGKFGGVRTANARFFAAKGLTGIYAPGVSFSGPVYIGDITASADATPVLRLGSASNTRITGGDLLQANGAAVQVSGIAQLVFAAGSDSHGNLLPAQRNRAVLTQDGTDVTAQVVVSP